MNLKLDLVLSVIRIGLWSELRSSRGVQVRCRVRESVAEVMSGEVACWLRPGRLVVMSVFSVMFVKMSAISCPRWSVVGECHSWSWAFASLVRMLLSVVVMWISAVVMSLSAFAWSGSVVFLGGMYRLKMSRVLVGDR